MQFVTEKSSWEVRFTTIVKGLGFIRVRTFQAKPLYADLSHHKSGASCKRNDRKANFESGEPMNNVQVCTSRLAVSAHI